ncbi:hypothetical protein Tco_0777299 [Tanacetum coccineum]
MTDTRIKPLITTIPDDLYMDDETTADEQADSSGDEVGRDHIPTVNLRQSWIANMAIPCGVWGYGFGEVWIVIEAENDLFVGFRIWAGNLWKGSTVF